MARMGATKTIKIKRSSLDLDFADKETFERVRYKISRCRYNYYTVAKFSMSKGYHLILWCSKVCDLCRFTYDDPKRYYADITNRKPHERDVCFDRKIRKPYNRKS